MRVLTCGAAILVCATVVHAQTDENKITRPTCVNCPQPNYSEKALKANCVIVLSVMVLTDGKVDDVTVLVDPRPELGLAEKAVQVVQHWQFTPAKLPDGTLVTARIRVGVVFRPPQAPSANPAGSSQPGSIPALIRQGYSITGEAAKQLEENLGKDPEDVSSRAKLLGFYFIHSQGGMPIEEVRKARLGHILWLIQHHPDSELLATSEATIDATGHALADPHGYETARAAWLAQTEKYKDSTRVLLNAARFFTLPDMELAADLLKRAHAVDPQNRNVSRLLGDIYAKGILGETMTNQNNLPTAADPELANGPVARKFREELEKSDDVNVIGQAGYILAFHGSVLSAVGKAPPDYSELAERYLLRALAADPTLVGDQMMLNLLYQTLGQRATSPEARAALAKKRLETLEKAQISDDPQKKLFLLPLTARAAFDAGEFEKAVANADELLSIAAGHEQDPEYGEAVHQGHIILGRVALQQNDVEKAKAHLLAAGRINGGATLNSFGPNMSLAKELLDKGEREVVLQYLDLCAGFWVNDHGQLAKWKGEIQAGSIPNFANLIY
jgi:TonB family protein